MIRKRLPNKAKAISLLEAAKLDMSFILSLKPKIESGVTIVSRVYEDFRMLGEALLSYRGKEASGKDHHVDMIQELFTLEVNTPRPIVLINNLKDLRNKINYKGYLPSIEEINDSLSLANSLFDPMIGEILKEIGKLN